MYRILFLGLMIFSLTNGIAQNVMPKGLYSVNGQVNAIYDDGDHVYIGGGFNSAHILNQRGMVFLESSTPKKFKLSFNDVVKTSVSDDNGGFFAGGDFTVCNGESVNHLVHILPNGELNMNFLPNINGFVESMAYNNGVLYVGGNFTSVNGQPKASLVALNVNDGTIVSSFDIQVTSLGPFNVVSSMFIKNDILSIGGTFLTLNGASQKRVSRIDVAVTPAAIVSQDFDINTQPGLSAAASANARVLLEDGDYLYVGGVNFDISGFSGPLGSMNLRRYHLPTQSWDMTYQPTTNGAVFALYLDNNQDLFIGGSFFNVNGTARSTIAKLNNSGVLLPWNCGVTSNSGGAYVGSIIEGEPGKVIFSGNITSAGMLSPSGLTVSGSSIISADASNANVDLSFYPNPNGAVRTLAKYNNSIFAGGDFTNTHARTRHRILRLNRSDLSLDESWNFNGFQLASGNVFAIEGNQNELFVGGNFTNVQGNFNTQHLIKVNKGNGLGVYGWFPNANGPVYALAIDDINNFLYVGGEFTQINNQNFFRMARVSTVTAQASSFASNITHGSVRAMRLNEAKNRIFVGGTFSNYNSYTTRAFAYNINAPGGQVANTLPMPVNDDVYGIDLYGDTVTVSGLFSEVDGTPRSRIAKFTSTPSSMVLQAFSSQNDFNVLSAAGINGNTVYGGNFSNAGGGPSSKLAIVDENGLLISNNVDVTGVSGTPFVGVVNRSGNRVYIGGNFGLVGNKVLGNFAMLEFDCLDVLNIAQQPSAPATLCNGSSFNLEVDANGNNAISYQWFKNEVPIPGETNPVLQFNNVDASDAGDYYVVLESGCKLIQSDEISLNPVSSSVTIIDQPVGTEICDFPSTQTLTANLSGTFQNLQWKFNGVNISGANQPSVVLNILDQNDLGNYFLEIEDDNGCVLNTNSVSLLESEPIHSYGFEEGLNMSISNGIVEDLTGNNDLTIVNTNGFVVAIDRFGLNRALGLNTPQNSVLDMNDISEEEVSVSLWVKPNFGGTGYATLIASDNTSGDVHLLVDRVNNAILMIANGNFVNTTGNLINNQWNHLVWMGNQSSNKIYLNGTLILNETSNFINTLQNPISRFMNNSVININQGFNTPMDELKIYDKELTQDEILFLASFQPESNYILNGVCENSAINMTHQLVNSVPGVTYQWYKNGLAINGATSNTYNIPQASAADDGEYVLEAKLNCVVITAPPYNLVVSGGVAPIITSQPVAATLCDGDSYTLNIGLSGAFTNVQWFYDGQPVFTGTSVVVPSLAVGDTLDIYAEVTSACGVLTSNVINFDFYEDPVITAQPQNNSVCVGGTTTFSVAANGPSLSYQWYFAGNPIAGETNSTLALNNVSTADQGDYYVVVTGACESVQSNNATLLIQEAPQVQSISPNSEFCEGDQLALSASFSVPGTAYQWLFNGNPLTGQNTTSLTINNVAPANAGNYVIEASNSCGSITSNVVVVGINPIFNTTISEEVCFGDSYQFNGTSYTASGTYTANLQSQSGCDSTVHLNLVVNQEITNTINESICFGDVYNFNGQTLNQSGVYTDVLTAADGCDSTVTLNLNVLPEISSNINESICFGSQYQLGTQTLTQSGVYNEVFTAVDGCDSTVNLTLTVLPEITNQASAGICQGGQLQFGGQLITQPGVYTETFVSYLGCDSTVTLTVNQVIQIEVTLNENICFGDSYVFDGTQLNQSGVYEATFQAVGGCDSIVTLNLTVENQIDNGITLSGLTLTASSSVGSYQWVDCDNGNAPIQGENNQTFLPSSPSNYAVLITVNGCSELSDCIFVNPELNVDEQKLLEISLYPNPAETIVYLENVPLNSNLAIYDAVGKLLFTGINESLTHEFQVDKLDNGVYTVVIAKDDVKKIKRFVINK